MPAFARSHPRRLALLQLGIILAAAMLAGLAWFGAALATGTQRDAALHEMRADAARTAMSYMDQVHREMLAVDQTLNILEIERQRDPAGFDLGQWQRRLVDLSDVVSQIFLLDARGVVVASTRPGLLGADLSGRPYFEALRKGDPGRPLIGAPVQEDSSGNWVVNMTRRINGPGRQFLGATVVSYNVAALTSSFGGSELGRGDVAALVGGDGIIRALVADGFREPGASIAGTPLMRQIAARANAWVGRYPLDGRIRSFALSPVPGQDLTVMVGIDQDAAIAAVESWRIGALGFAAVISLLLALMAAGLIRGVREARLREARLQQDRAVLAGANTALERARASADAKSDQLESIITSMSDGISLFDRDLRLVQWNDHFPENAGVPRDMLRPGMPFEEILRAQARAGEFGPIEAEAAIEAEVERRIASLRAGTVGVTERARPDGRVLELRRARLPGGGFVTLYTDITPRKQVEEAHRRARAVAEAAAEEKSRFVAVVSHEIRTPLNVTLNAVALLEQSVLDPVQRRHAMLAVQAGDALRALLNDILDLSRLEVGRLALRPAEFELRPLLESVVGMFREAAAARGVGLELRIGAGVPARLVTDASRLRQVLMNLAGNAVKFAEPGPACLAASIAVEDGRSVLCLALRNAGRLIADADRERLFRPFSQLTDARAGTGAGLGLAICQQLTTLLGGRIGFRAADGDNEFWITLPLAGMAGVEPEIGAPRPGRRRTARARVLLAEDVPANRMVIATLLRREGHAVEAAGDGEAAVVLAAARPFDIIFMDINMPGMGGIEATRRIRALPGPVRRVPILALTANIAPDEQQRCREAGMDDALPKPAERAALAEAVQRHFHGRGPDGRWPDPHLLAPAAVEAIPARPDDGPALDADYIARLSAELPSGLFAGLVESCLADLRERLPALEAALAAGDCDTAAAVAHAMAGVAASYGIVRLADRLRLVLTAARTRDAAMATGFGQGLGAELAEAESAFRAMLTPAPA